MTTYRNHFWSSPEADAYFAELNAGYFAQLELQNDATIERHRYPRPSDRVLSRYGEARPGNLPSDEELDDRGVNRTVLAWELQKGMNARVFTRALRQGFDIGILNKRLYHLVEGEPMNDILDAFLEARRPERQRERRAANRVLATFFERI